jgi:hypothetical protein
MQGLEPLVVEEYIFTQLNVPALTSLVPDAPGQTLVEIYSDTVPPDVRFPYVIFQMQSNSDTMTTDGTRVLWVATYIVKAVGRTKSYIGLGPIASQIDILLHKQSGVVSDGTVLHSRRLQVVRYPEVTDGVNYRHLGGSYRFWTEAT